tara:strand:+ start:1283 stop:1720 length:438 start_codon:yes stop_codon:yes gene_type:complete
MAEEREAKFEEVLKYVRNGLSVSKACKEQNTVGETLFYKMVGESVEREKNYERAREKRADVIFEEIKEIADKQDKDVYIDSEGNEKTDHNIVQRSRLQIDARKWMLGKMNPKKYSDSSKLDLTTNGESINIISLGNGIDPNESIS